MTSKKSRPDEEDTVGATGAVTDTRRNRAPRSRGLQPGSFIGRYVVGRVVGEGAMGVVHEAYDPELDRTVAVKVLQGHDESNVARRSRRLHREAQALAQLSHPNVVTVHDVGQHEGNVFIAMELVAGQTVRAWLRAQPRPWSEVVDVLSAAARGLAAAHDQGLVHRDFKPANVMIADDGRILVMDFGLARVDFSSEGSTSERPVQGLSDSPILDVGPTQDGPLVGTPAYISPEQHLGRPADARSDQFAFCVSLWEGLYGRRPFNGRTVGELMAKVLDGLPEIPPSDRDVPRWLQKVVLRGLSRDPHDRYASMHGVLHALEARDRARPGRLLAMAAGLGAAMVATAYAVGVVADDRTAKACARDGAAIEQAWSAQRRRAVHDGVAGTGSSYAAETADRVVAALDLHADSWSTSYARACLASEVEEVPGWSDELYLRAQWCFQSRKAQLESLVDELSVPDTLAVQRAPFAAGRLEDPAQCADTEVLRVIELPPPEGRGEVEAVEAELQRASVLSFIAAYREGLEVAESASRRAHELGWAPLIARAEAVVGRLQVGSGRDEAGRKTLEAAHYRALEAADHATAFATARALTTLCGVTLANHAQGWDWHRHAESALARLPDPSGLRAVDLLSTRAAILTAEARYDEARQAHEDVLTQYTAILGTDHPEVGMALQATANVDQMTGDYARAEELYVRAVDVLEVSLGPEHPEVAKTMSNLAIVLVAQGRYPEAREQYEGALLLLERALGSEHPDLGVVLTNLALLLEQTGDLNEAMAKHQRALVLVEKTSGSPVEIAIAMHNVAGMHYSLGDYDRARPMFEKVIALLEGKLGPNHPQVSTALQMLALVAHTQGDGAYAYDVYERALGIVRESLGPKHPDVAALQNGLASIDMDEERFDTGRRRLDEAIAIEQEAFGPRHPNLMTSYNNAATLEFLRERYPESEHLYRLAQGICEAHPELDPRTCSYPLFGLARIALEQGRPAEALPLAEQATQMRVDGSASPTELADVRFALARALWSTRVDRARAVELARQAASDYREESFEPEALQQVESWLRRHRGPT